MACPQENCTTKFDLLREGRCHCLPQSHGKNQGNHINTSGRETGEVTGQKATLERPGNVHQDLLKDSVFCLKKLSEFTEYPFSLEEEVAGAVERIVDLCSFEKLSSLEVNNTALGCSRITEQNLKGSGLTFNSS
ncbi:hypothetical protein CRYUN_Cryun22dG0091000 [Craigia yunnanensis]